MGRLYPTPAPISPHAPKAPEGAGIHRKAAIGDPVTSEKFSQSVDCKNETRPPQSDSASQTLPDLVNPFIQCAESGMNASVVKAEQIGK
jgi:hypothetical protein